MNLKRQDETINGVYSSASTLKKSELTGMYLLENQEWNVTPNSSPDRIGKYKIEHTQLSQSSNINIPYHMTQNNDDLQRGIAIDLKMPFQNLGLLAEQANTHYSPMADTEAKHQNRVSVIRFAKSNGCYNKSEIQVADEKISAPINADDLRQPAVTTVPFKNVKPLQLHHNEIEAIITPPASLVDFNENEHQHCIIENSSASNVCPDNAKVENMTVIGPNKSAVLATDLKRLNLKSIGNATRGLLDLLFTFEELATHSLTGKPSPAFYGRERPKKYPLDPKKVDDVIDFVNKKTGASPREVRQIITAKCADSAKKYRKRLKTV